MRFEIASFLVGLVAGCFLTVSLAFPRLGRVLARIASAVMFIGGIGLLVWAIGAVLLDATMTPFLIGGVLISQPTEAFGWGAGLLAGGILTLILSSLRP